MKYLVIITLVGLDTCGTTVHTKNQFEVESEQLCLQIVEEYVSLPFVLQTECIVTNTND